MADGGGEFEDVLDMDGLATLLKVSTEWVRTKVKRRQIPFTRLPGTRLVRFRPAHVRAILDAGEEPAQNGPLAPTRPQAAPAGPAMAPVDIRRRGRPARPKAPVDIRRGAA